MTLPNIGRLRQKVAAPDNPVRPEPVRVQQPRDRSGRWISSLSSRLDQISNDLGEAANDPDTYSIMFAGFGFWLTLPEPVVFQLVTVTVSYFSGRVFGMFFIAAMVRLREQIELNPGLWILIGLALIFAPFL